jgi:hypothetical protein
MDAVYIPLLSALAGALIGSFSSIGTIYLQARLNRRRERARQAAEIAMQDFKNQMELAKLHIGAGKGVNLMPLVVHFHWYWQLLEAIEEGNLTPEKLKSISESNEQIGKTIRELN